MLIHEIGRSRKDFEDAILDLKGQGLAEHLRGLGYSIFSMDLRGQGQNPRGQRHEAQQLIEDLQAGYFFLLDRHNRGDLNLAKLGVIALGDGANLAAAWAFQPGAAITTEGRASDLSALVMISPKPEGFGYVLGHLVASLAPGFPYFSWQVIAITLRRTPSNPFSKLYKRARLNKVELFPSSLHGYKFLRLEPKITATMFQFLETALKNRPVEWEPQYNLTPVTFGDAQIVMNAKPTDGEGSSNHKDQAKDAGPPRPPNAKADDAKKKKADEIERKLPAAKEAVPAAPKPANPD